ncbi:MAG: DUF1624 domain-containing protein [Sandaracinaceae bacterium]|nr:DUF1624 domain-containing protein [Sandaracinaceae bacterium]
MNATPEGKTKQRFLALDLLRFLAVLLMVQGHVFREVLTQDVRGETWFRWHEYIHGFTAPIFLFASGLAFGLTTFRGWDKHLSWGETLRKRFERYFLLLVIAYWVQLPQLSLGSVLASSDARMARILKVDALHNIGITLLVAELLVITLRKPRRYTWVLGALAVLAVAIAPALAQLNLENVPRALAGFIQRSGPDSHFRSYFPLAPFSAFLLSGIVTAYFLFDERTRSFKLKAGPWLLGLGVLTYFAGEWLTQAIDLETVYGPHNYWVVGPFFFFVRIGVVWAVLGALATLTQLLPRLLENPVGRTVQVLGQETLVIYVSHLFLLYGSPLNKALARQYKYSLSVAESTLCFLAVLGATGLLAWVWHQAKTRQPRAFDLARWSMTALLVFLFFWRS